MSTITKEQIKAIVDQLSELKAEVDSLYCQADADSYAEHYLGSVGDDVTNAYDSAHQLMRKLS